MIHTLTLDTRGQGFYGITLPAERFVAESGVNEGLLTVFARHTSCSLLIQENADPAVHMDLKAFLNRLIPPVGEPGTEWVTHDQEGPDDMPAHIKSALTQTSIGIPVCGGQMMLGTWQGLYLFEHRDRVQRREIVFHIAD